MAHVFISYSRKDRDTAAALARLLESEGLEVWWDPVIVGGQSFPDEIRREISQAHHVIVLWSRHSIESDWVLREAALAAESKKLLPVNLDGCELPEKFAFIHTIEGKNWNELLRELYRTVGGGSLAWSSYSVMAPLASATRAPAAPPVADQRRFVILAVVIAVIVLAIALYLWLGK